MCCFKQMTAYEMRISDWSSDVCASDLKGARQSIRLITSVAFASKSASTCNSNGHWAATPSRQWSKRRPDASLLPGLPIAHAEGRKKQEIKYTWPRSSPLSEPDPVLGPRSCSTSADFRRAVQRLISSSITALISVSLKRSEEHPS